MERLGPVQVVSGPALRSDPPHSQVKRLSCSSPIIEIIHFHKAIKSELSRLCQAVVALENGAQVDFSHLSERYQFLHSVYKYHSQAEDEVILPALDLRVKNVAHAYSLEHEAEGDIFVQLAGLLAEAGTEYGGPERAELLRQLVCTAEALQTTLRQHLNKEEEQVFPLLMQNFNFEEQAALVWQFMCCIPVNLLEEVLPWVAAELNPQERQEMVAHIHDVVPSEELLLEVVSTWLRKGGTSPDKQTGWWQKSPDTASLKGVTPGHLPVALDSSRREKVGDENLKWKEVEVLAGSASKKPATGDQGRLISQPVLLENRHAIENRFPINEIVHFHNAIRKELEGFAEEARALRVTGTLSAVSLTSLVERYRFLSDVCIFHSAAEDEVVFKAALDRNIKLPRTYMGFHGLEEQQFLDVGRLLAGARTAEVGSAAAEQIIADLCQQADTIVSAVRQHFLDEEAEVLPLVQQHFTVEEQRVLMYQSLRAMPLRLLEQVLPWVMALLTEEEALDMVRNMQLAAPPVDSALVALFSGWANKGRSGSRSTGETSSPSDGGDDVSSHPLVDKPETTTALREGCNDDGAPLLKRKTSDEGSGGSGPPRKKTRMEAGLKTGELVSVSEDGEGKPSRGNSTWSTRPLADLPTGGLPLRSPGLGGAASFWGRLRGGSETIGRAPIDHIFQFHRAIRKDLEYLDLASGQLLHCDDQFFSDFDGRFQFLWGIYRAHSSAEDNIVFPALEAKEALHNVSHSYSIDHQQEEQLFDEIAQALEELKACRVRVKGGTAGGDPLPAGRQAVTAGTPLPKLLDHAGLETCSTTAEEQGEGLRVQGGAAGAHAPENLSTLVSLDSQADGSASSRGVGEGLAAAATSPGALDEYTAQVMQLQRMCKSVRVSLDKHVSSEEVELWPLFGIHFSVEEQDAIVGRIIGCTGAEVLQAMLPFVTTALTDEEQGEMMKNWRNASRNTMFDQWLSAWWKDKGAAHDPPQKIASLLEEGDSSRLAEVAEYLNQNGGVPEVPSGAESETEIETGGEKPSKSKGELEELREQQLVHQAERITPHEGAVGEATSKDPPLKRGAEEGASSSGKKEGEVEGSNFKPGWEDIFRMNQKELEAAIRKVSRDSTLEPQRKAYLMQNLMTSRWIVAQQKVTPAAASGGEGSQELRPSYHDEAKGIFGCEHYQRNCKVKAACCGQLVTCRFCHDKDSDHTMDRHAVREMMCMTCLVVQPVAQHCATPSCEGRSMAGYYCSVCKFFDDSGKDIYHCPFCNLCRVGKGLGIDFFHCMSCNACMSLSLSSHTCREKGLESNCPICHDFLFTSNTPVKALPCGHFMHSLCYQSYTHGHYTCPICSKSLGDMAVYFGMLDALLDTEELPEEYRDKKQEILCNDCERKGTASFHFVYHKCSHCGSYNTRTV